MPQNLQFPARQTCSDNRTEGHVGPRTRAGHVGPRTRDGLENGKQLLFLRGIKSQFPDNHICSLTAIKREFQPKYITSKYRVTTA
jgi:hypothetical protein